MDCPPTVDELVRHFGLSAHPEGGYFRETFRDGDCIAKEALPPSCDGPRSRSTAILFLLPHGCASRLHRITFAEVWHFYLGDALTVVELLDDTGTAQRTVLGPNVLAGQQLQHVVPGDRWFGAVHDTRCGVPRTGYTLVGCTVAPGFDFKDFELASRDELLTKFPAAAEEIQRLT